MLKLGITNIEQLLGKEARNTRLIAIPLLLELSSANINPETANRLRQDIILAQYYRENNLGKQVSRH